MYILGHSLCCRKANISSIKIRDEHEQHHNWCDEAVHFPNQGSFPLLVLDAPDALWRIILSELDMNAIFRLFVAYGVGHGEQSVVLETEKIYALVLRTMIHRQKAGVI